METNKKEKRTFMQDLFGNLSFIVGVISIATDWIIGVNSTASRALEISAIAFGLIALVRKETKSKAVLGILMGLIGVFFWIFIS
ncbi:MAG: hypothetical protein FWD82_03225 [Defluviitaleaceae bacterium]|nr:hypothetical protein [Defluviitaleaceae bacterium]